ncbi:MAG: APC family permease [Micromonosporaceae bacterium]
MATAAPPAPPAQQSVARKGLKLGAIGLLSSVVIGVASTAPGYSLAATLGGVASEVGLKSPIIMLLAFVPMLFISYAYKALNNASPDCGTSFTWVAKAFGPRAGWITGWVIVAADIIVMAALAQIAGVYGFLLFGLDDLAANSTWVTVAGCAWILLMTLISWRGIELSARTQYFLLGAELLILATFAVVALVKVYAGSAGDLAIKPALDWFVPTGLSFTSLSAGFLLAVFIYWGWDSAVTANEETTDPTVNPGRAAVRSTVVLLVTYLLVTVAAQAFAGVGEEGIGLTNPEHSDDVLSSVGAAVLGGTGVKLLIIAVLTSAAASTQTTILPTARTTLAMAAYRALPRAFGTVHPRFQTPTVSTWAMGLVSIAFYAGLTYFNDAALSDLILSIGLMIAFYYGLTGFASAWFFRRELFGSATAFFMKGLFPVLGGVILFAAMTRTVIDSYATDFGDTVLFHTGGVFVLGVGSVAIGVVLMIIWNLVAPAYFRGGTLRADAVVGESGRFTPAGSA